MELAKLILSESIKSPTCAKWCSIVSTTIEDTDFIKNLIEMCEIKCKHLLNYPELETSYAYLYFIIELYNVEIIPWHVIYSDIICVLFDKLEISYYDNYFQLLLVIFTNINCNDNLKDLILFDIKKITSNDKLQKRIKAHFYALCNGLENNLLSHYAKYIIKSYGYKRAIKWLNKPIPQ